MKIFELLKDNPMAAAIIGGAPIAAIITYVLNQLKWIPTTLFNLILLNVTSFIEIFETFSQANTTSVDAYNRANDYFLNLNNKYIKNNMKISSSLDDGSMIGNGTYYITQLFKTYKVLIVLNVSKIPRDDIGGTSTLYTMNKTKLHQVFIRIYGSNKNRDKFIKDFNHYITNNDNDLIINLNKYYPIIKQMQSYDGTTIDFNFQPKRLFSSIYMDKEYKEILRTFIHSFINGRQVYEDANIIYKTGIMLFGEPGTGKTSTIKAICSELNAPMFIVPPSFNTEQILNNLQIMKGDLKHKNISCNLPITKNKIQELNYMNRPIVIVFEEFDKFFKLEPGAYMSGGVIITPDDVNDNGYKVNTNRLQEFLQFLDGIDSPSNVIFIATTNHMDHIDPAILRKGRFDLKFEMKKINYELASEMIKDICPHKEVSDYIKPGEDINSSELFSSLIFEQLKQKQKV